MKVKTTVQLSLDLIDLHDALEAAEVAIRAGVDWLEAGPRSSSLKAATACASSVRAIRMCPSSPI